MIENLMTNAMESLADVDDRQRKVIISTRWKDERNIVVAVRDFGTGLDEDKTDRIFDPFYTSKSDGLGMGLPISRTIIEAHGGQLWYANNPDRGATFYFSLPLGEGINDGFRANRIYRG